MCLVELRAPARLALIAGAALALPTVAQAAIVVAASGPSAPAYPVGRKLDDKATVTLRAGDTVTVLDAKGTRVLRGAGTFPVVASAGTPQKNSTFAVLTMQRSAQRVRTGAVRAGQDGTPPASPNLWFVDTTKPGKRCIVAGQPVRLWRLDTSTAMSMTARVNSGAPIAVSFPAGAMVAPLATTLPNGATLDLAAPGKAPARFTVAVLPSQPADPESTAAALIGQGCTGQLDLLSTTLARP